MPLNLNVVSILLATVLVASCSDQAQTPATSQQAAPWVKTALVRPDSGASLKLSGTVRARFETPVAFQIPGRIAVRAVDAGQRVKPDQVLFELDARDLEQSLKAAQAEKSAAQASVNTALADLRRNRELLNDNFISKQGFERVELTAKEAQTRAEAAQVKVKQAQNALGYAVLRADSPGILMDVTAEPAQVVNAGQSVATLAKDGEREIEVFLPDGITPPVRGSIQLKGGDQIPVTLRESAGASEVSSRTVRARYQLPTILPEPLQLGSVIRIDLQRSGQETGLVTVPIGALDERGDGARVWQVINGKAQAVPVKVISIGMDEARVQGKLSAGSRVISLGTHLLTPGMAVRDQLK